jgi:bacteriorhodopsin
MGPVDDSVVIIDYVEAALLSLVVLISLFCLMFSKEVPKKYILARFLVLNTVAAVALVVFALLETYSTDVKTRDGDAKSVAWGRWAAYLISTPALMEQTASYLHMSFTWKSALGVLGFALNLLRLMAAFTSDSAPRWVELSAQVFVGFCILWILVHHSRATVARIVLVVLASALFGISNTIFFALDESQFSVLSYQWTSAAHLVVDFFVHVVWGFCAMSSYDKPASNLLTNSRHFLIPSSWRSYIESSKRATSDEEDMEIILQQEQEQKTLAQARRRQQLHGPLDA